MLVLKIKPCKSKYKRIYTVRLQKAHYISYCLGDGRLTTWITVVILELIHAIKLLSMSEVALLVAKASPTCRSLGDS